MLDERRFTDLSEWWQLHFSAGIGPQLVGSDIAGSYHFTRVPDQITVNHLMQYIGLEVLVLVWLVDQDGTAMKWTPASGVHETATLTIDVAATEPVQFALRPVRSGRHTVVIELWANGAGQGLIQKLIWEVEVIDAD